MVAATDSIAAFLYAIAQGVGIGATGSNPAAPYTAQQNVTAAAVALVAQPLVNGIVIKAKSTNVGTVYVGPTGVTSGTGYPLLPGEAISFGVTNASAVFIIGTLNDTVYVAGN